MTPNETPRTLQKVAVLVAGCLVLGCGPSAAVEEHPPGHLEYDFRVVLAYRDGARVEYVPVPEEIDGGMRAVESYEAFADCYYLNEEGLRRIEDTIAGLYPSSEYPPEEWDPQYIDLYSPDELHLVGFVHSPFLCPVIGQWCNDALSPIAGVYSVVTVNLDGITPTDEDGNELWYLDTTRTCEPGAWRSPGG